MIKDYLNQIATWKRVVGKNMYGEPDFDTKEIKVRWEGKRKLVRNNEGREVVSEARVFCTDPVQPGDLLEFNGRRWPVITASIVPDLGGKESHRECAV
jgi:hypothetical protein